MQATKQRKQDGKGREGMEDQVLTLFFFSYFFVCRASSRMRFAPLYRDGMSMLVVDVMMG